MVVLHFPSFIRMIRVWKEVMGYRDVQIMTRIWVLQSLLVWERFELLQVEERRTYNLLDLAPTLGEKENFIHANCFTCWVSRKNTDVCCNGHQKPNSRIREFGLRRGIFFFTQIHILASTNLKILACIRFSLPISTSNFYHFPTSEISTLPLCLSSPLPS